MTDLEIQLLKHTVKNNKVIWMPDSTTAFQVTGISTHKEEEDDDILCAIFSNGKYAALYNCDLREFVTVKEIK